MPEIKNVDTVINAAALEVYKSHPAGFNPIE